jgi:Uri superfamily endonuclease
MAKKMSTMIPIDRIPDSPGTYTLIIELNQEIEIEVGKLGVYKFPNGNYTYTGSALGKGAVGLRGRLQRHVSKIKTLHWHIDYFLNAKESQINHIVFFESNKQYECMIIKELLSLGGKIIVRGFGASDCKSGCKSHLLFFEDNEKRVRRIVKKVYEAITYSNNFKEYSPEGIS